MNKIRKETQNIRFQAKTDMEKKGDDNNDETSYRISVYLSKIEDPIILNPIKSDGKY